MKGSACKIIALAALLSLLTTTLCSCTAMYSLFPMSIVGVLTEPDAAPADPNAQPRHEISSATKTYGKEGLTLTLPVDFWENTANEEASDFAFSYVSDYADVFAWRDEMVGDMRYLTLQNYLSSFLHYNRIETEIETIEEGSILRAVFDEDIQGGECHYIYYAFQGEDCRWLFCIAYYTADAQLVEPHVQSWVDSIKIVG